MKNLPVRPLAPRRKTPGQLYPIFNGPPGKTKEKTKGLKPELLINEKTKSL